jgi:hypothetical protein
METVFVVQHLHVLPDDEEDVKFIGVYSSSASARAAIERLRTQPGFHQFPNVVDSTKGEDEQGFYIEEYRIDQDHWPEGFVTV